MTLIIHSAITIRGITILTGMNQAGHSGCHLDILTGDTDSPMAGLITIQGTIPMITITVITDTVLTGTDIIHTGTDITAVITTVTMISIMTITILYIMDPVVQLRQTVLPQEEPSQPA